VVDDPDSERKARLGAALLRHLQRCPLAGDTSEGMVACWIPRRGYEDATRFISQVIDEMVAAGELVAMQLPDGRALYVGGPAVRAHE